MTFNEILVTPRSLTQSGHPALARFERAGFRVRHSAPGKLPSEDELRRLLPGCVGYLAGVEPVTRRVLDVAGGLRAISRNGTGTDNIDLEAAREKKIAILRVDGANARGVAELTIGLTLALARSLPFSDRRMKADAWQRRKGIELAGRTMGLVGCGRIGRLVAELAIGLGMNVLGFDPVRNEELRATVGFRYADLNEVLAHSDILSLHCPPCGNGRPILTRPRIAAMKDGAYLINAARGDLLDDEAVIEALDAGKLAGAAIDAFREEPPSADPLVQHDKVIAVPHIGGYTEESVDRAVEGAVDNLLAALRKGGC